MKEYKVIGLMSGTSLDGLDIACCHFSFDSKWAYKILAAETISYDRKLKNALTNAHLLSGEKLSELNARFGKFCGEQVNRLIRKHKISKVDLISSHGHTVFHQPEKGFTLQIGSGAVIAAEAGIQTVCDFRSTDVANGGQGAPLVPIGDKLLFSEYDACLNLGGIANISFTHKAKRVAFDICPVNIVLNSLAQRKSLPYDKGGKLASKGSVHWLLLKKLNGLSFYKSYQSKSLGREWIDSHVLSIVNKEKISVEDKLATCSEHAALQIARVLSHFKIKRVLITGGGVYNADLIKRVEAYSDCEIQIPDDQTIQFKEALIFAFLGVLRLRGEENCLKEVTGARRNSVGGAVYL